MHVLPELRYLLRRSVLILSLLLSGCSVPDNKVNDISPPVAQQHEKRVSIHGIDRIDEYYWIRDDTRKDPDVLNLLAEENAYTSAVMAGSEKLQHDLFVEISGRLVANDRTVPVKKGNYLYLREFHEGGEYPLYIRSPADNPKDEEVLLDANNMSKGHEFYHIGNWSVSPGEGLLAFAEDVVSRREYTIRFKDLTTGERLKDEIPKVAPSIAWAADNRTVFYVDKNPETLLPYRVYRHEIGSSRSDDVQVYEELDDAFSTSVYVTRSQKFIVISIESIEATEIRLIDANNTSSSPKTFLPREDSHEYKLRHIDDMFYIRTNWQADNFRLMKVKDSELGDKAMWQEVIAHRPGILLRDFEVFNDYLVAVEQSNGLPQLRIIKLYDEAERVITFSESAYTVYLHSNPEVSSSKLRYVYSSLTTPLSDFELDMETGESILLKEEKVLGGFDRSLYRTERRMFSARDGTQVPVSLVYRRDLYRKGTNPIYLYAYGAYGYSMNPSFLSKRLSLLDRGFVYAIVHVRGGSELGRQWYEDGKLLNKKNSFFDFIDGTRFLIAEGYASADKVFAAGGSAGGLIMGVIANEAPGLYQGIVADVPFVDVVTTMLDESIPLTSGEFTEWGNPKDKQFYQYMLSYSPYDQVKAQKYPNMLVTTGLNDSQVQYFEPVKWVSRLRRLKLDDNLLLISISMDSGHSGASGRYERHWQDALEYAFVLELSDNDSR
ncbi:MAG: oligopeptidase B [Gammaproteobacteria bacterium]|nr:oligopeptidase B [Gammaproteobacteria bacterium]